MVLKGLGFAGAIGAAIVVVVACAAAPKGIPEGPAPEYERHPLPSWDGGPRDESVAPAPAASSAESTPPEAPAARP